MTRLLLSLLVLVLGSSSAFSQGVNPERAYYIRGVIAQGNIAKIGEDILRRAVDGDTDEPVDLIISSPGGSTVTGFQFVSMMERAKSLGLTIRCFVPDVAASMAFSILVHCSQRLVLERSFLLWHRARVFLGGGFGGTAVTAPDATHLAYELDALDRLIYREVSDSLNLNDRFVRYHFEKETLHLGIDLCTRDPGFCEAYEVIPGLYEAMHNPKVMSSSSPGPFDLFQPGQIIYIKSGVLQ